MVADRGVSGFALASRRWAVEGAFSIYKGLGSIHDGVATSYDYEGIVQEHSYSRIIVRNDELHGVARLLVLIVILVSECGICIHVEC